MMRQILPIISDLPNSTRMAYVTFSVTVTYLDETIEHRTILYPEFMGDPSEMIASALIRGDVIFRQTDNTKWVVNVPNVKSVKVRTLTE